MANEAQPAIWLTARRLRAHALLLGLALWSIYFWTLASPGWRDRNGNLKGTDFLYFYTSGCLAATHRGADLYDMSAHAALAVQRVPGAAGIRYLPLYPPQVSILFAPFAYLPYGWALAICWLFSALLYGVCCLCVWRACPKLRHHGGTVALLAAAYPAFFHLIAWGQTSALALAICTVAFFLLRGRREFLGGLVLGCLIFKPQLGLAAAILFVAIGSWRIVCGTALSAAAQLAAGVLYYGVEPLRLWVRALLNVGGVMPFFEPRPYQTHCLRTFWAMIVPWPRLSLGLYIVSAIIILGFTIAVWKRSTEGLALRYSTLLLATVLVAPHLTVYDLLILAPGMLLLSDWLLSQPLVRETRRMGTLLYLIYMLPLVGPLAHWTHIQLSVIAMSMLAYCMFQVAQKRSIKEQASVEV